MKSKISIIGSFGFGVEMRDGQTVKTVELYKLLSNEYGDDRINRIDTYGWKQSPWRLFGNVIKAATSSECIILLPAQNSLRVIPQLVLSVKKKGVKCFYSVIGGWLPEFLHDKPRLVKSLKRLDGIWVETKTMKQQLDKIGFDNIKVIPNFKSLNILTAGELVYSDLLPMKLCIFSRINQMKGITDAINAVIKVNNDLRHTVYTLDIYGLISEEYKVEFDILCTKSPSYINYKGCVPPEQSVNVIKNYFALLFPTLYPTEGIPGTIIDAYAAGVPIISAKWNSFSDIVDEGQTGVGFLQGDFTALLDILKKVAKAPEVLSNMKVHCLNKALEYSPQRIKTMIQQQLEGEYEQS